MLVASSHPALGPVVLDSCRGSHPQLMWRCPIGAVACHAGTFPDEVDIFQDPNRILVFADQLRGTSLVKRVDLHEVDPTYKEGSQVVTMHKNDELFLDGRGVPCSVLIVSEYDAADVVCRVSVFTNEELAHTHFKRSIVP